MKRERAHLPVGLASEGMLAGRPAFATPREVVEDAGLTNEQKREILSGWASDARTCENEPTMRRLDSGAVVPVDDILGALHEIDRKRPLRPRRISSLLPLRGRLLMGEYIRAGRRRPDRDDDPPPLPSRARPPRPPRDGSDEIRLPERIRVG